jgi:hypothetical protein
LRWVLATDATLRRERDAVSPHLSAEHAPHAPAPPGEEFLLTHAIEPMYVSAVSQSTHAAGPQHVHIALTVMLRGHGLFTSAFAIDGARAEAQATLARWRDCDLAQLSKCGQALVMMTLGAPARDSVRVPAELPPPMPPAAPERYADMPAALDALVIPGTLPRERPNNERTLGHIVRVLRRRGATHLPVMYWSKCSHELAGHVCSRVHSSQTRGAMPGGAPFALAGCEEAAMPPELHTRYVATEEELRVAQQDHAMALAHAMGGVFRRVAATDTPGGIHFPSLKLADLDLSNR